MIANSFVQQKAAAASSTVLRVGGYVAAVRDVVSTVYNDVYPKLPLVKPIFESFQEMNLSIFFRSLRENMLAKIKQSDLMSLQLSRHFEGYVPFVNVDRRPEDVVPEQVSQLKKILNALYHAEQCFSLIEQHPPILSTSSVYSLYSLYTEVSTHAHELIQITSSLDVNLTSYFSGEIAQLSSWIRICRQYAGPKAASLLDGSTWGNMQKKATAIGHYAGMATDKLQPHTGQTDFHFLTTFVGVLSGHLSALTDQIRSYASPSAERTPLITQERLAELTLSADELYRKMTQLQASGVSDPMSFGAMLKHPFVYQEIFGHITALSTSILAQMQKVNEGTQEAILHQLSELKNKHLLDLFCFIDKIELYGAFKPGALSKPILIYLKTWYELLVTQAHSVVDIHQVRPDLLVIEDSHFAHARMEAMLGRVATFTTKELSLANVPDAMKEFFTAIEGYMQHDQPLHLFVDREGLLLRYLFIRPFMLQKNPAFDLRLLRDLGHPLAQGMTEEPAVTVAECLQFKDGMNIALAKSIKSQAFYRILAEDMIQGIFLRVDTLVLPYPVAGKNPFMIDESRMLGIPDRQPLDPKLFFEQEHILLHHTLADNHDHASHLYEGYQLYLHKLALAKKACEDFQTQLNAPDWASHKPSLCNLYLRIQPYLMHLPLIVSAAGSESQDDRVKLDQAMIDCLHENHKPGTDDTRTLANTQGLINATLVVLNQHETFARIRGERFIAPTQAFLSEQILDSEIKLDPIACKRAHHVFSHERYSATVHQLSEAVHAILPLFSAPIRAELATAVAGDVPFPGLELEVESLKTSDQVLLLKQLMNALYYLEYFFKQMEQLDDRNKEITNSFYLIQATVKAIQFITVINTVRTDPNLAIMMNNVLQRIEQIQGVWLGLKPLYSIPSTDDGTPAEAATSNGTWYSMLSMMVLPEHLKALRAGRGFSPADAEPYQTFAKDTTLRIENILAHSDTNFHLFLASPDMIKVFSRVKETLSEFSGQTYESVMAHLQSIREETFPALLVETDEWELRLGVVPGTISTPVKKILDQFYLGLIEPLSLPSELQIALASSLASFDVRDKAFNRRITLADAECYRLEPYITTLTAFVTAIQSFKSGDDQAAFSACLNRALPLLREHQNRHTLGMRRLDQDDNIDSLCNELMPNERVPFKHIKFLAIRCLADYEGRCNTQRFKKVMIHEQLSALSTAKSAQVADNLAYKTRYVTELLHRHIDSLVTEQKDVLSLRDSYGETLKQCLLGQEATIETALLRQERTDNMQAKMEGLLQAPLQQFAQTEYRHFMKLQSILVAINAFECYLDQENAKLGNHEFLWFETGDTLAAKRAHIVRMMDITKDAAKPAATRLNEIQAMLIQPNVHGDLMAYHQYDRLSWDGLKQLFWQLLQAVGLYTPGYEAEYARLDSAASADAPESAQLLRSYGLFNTRRIYELPPAMKIGLPTATPS